MDRGLSTSARAGRRAVTARRHSPPNTAVSRIAPTLQSLRRRSRVALASYLVAGDPRPEATVACMKALARAGADVIELGVPFSDPMAEGPVIQRGHERALAGGVGVERTLAMVAEFRATDARTPVVLMGYANSMLRDDSRAFADAARSAGADGALVVDMPLEESGPTRRALAERGLDMILLVSPTTPLERARRIADAARGFVYYLSLKGVSGADHLAVDSLREGIETLRGLTELPVGVGFGIKTECAAEAVAALADVVIVGSALVECVGELAGSPTDELAAALARRLGALRAAADRGRTGAPEAAPP